MSTSENQASALYKLNDSVIGSVSRLKKIAVTSGKGGVGKTNVVANLGVAFSNRNLKVAILDADYGLGSIDILLGIEPEVDISHLLKDTASLEEILINKKELLIIPAGSGVQSLTQLSEYQEILLYKELQYLGYIRQDDHIQEAIKFQEPVVEKFPGCPVSSDYQQLAKVVPERVEQMQPGKEKKSRWDFQTG